MLTKKRQTSQYFAIDEPEPRQILKGNILRLLINKKASQNLALFVEHILGCDVAAEEFQLIFSSQKYSIIFYPLRQIAHVSHKVTSLQLRQFLFRLSVSPVTRKIQVLQVVLSLACTILWSRYFL